MLDLFAIFSKGGIVLWCCHRSKELFITSVNALIQTVILQERTSTGGYETGPLILEYKLDNEFELVFVAGYQKTLQLSYVDKFLSDMQRETRDRYKNDFIEKRYFGPFELEDLYKEILKNAVDWGNQKDSEPKVMRSYGESKKSQKTVASMIERPSDKKPEKEKKGKDKDLNENEGEKLAPQPTSPKPGGPRPGPGKFTAKSPKVPKVPKEKEGKKPRVWELGGSSKDMESLDRTKKDEGSSNGQTFVLNASARGTMAGQIKRLEVTEEKKESAVLGLFRGLVGGKTLSEEDLVPALEKLKDHLITKNVASEVAVKLCEAVSAKLAGKVVGTFQTIGSVVRSALEESLLALLQPKRQVDVLREALETKSRGRPFIITFCGVNGVGKSTNLAKICFWLIENGLRVLVAACDTFRAGAVEQLRTHARHLNALHPPVNGKAWVELYEKGYGKDAAGVAAEAIASAKDQFDVVLVDTAGRMQDNEPLMRALSKLIRVNNPDLVLFVGEALVGNEAVDQLVKFNRALADFSDQTNPRLIDGIVLTKFDTIDDKVGAAVSMAYITGQPIVFVGTGQTYTDLRGLDSRAVVNSLMK